MAVKKPGCFVPLVLSPSLVWFSLVIRVETWLFQLRYHRRVDRREEDQIKMAARRKKNSSTVLEERTFS